MARIHYIISATQQCLDMQSMNTRTTSLRESGMRV